MNTMKKEIKCRRTRFGNDKLTIIIPFHLQDVNDFRLATSNICRTGKKEMLLPLVLLVV